MDYNDKIDFKAKILIIDDERDALDIFSRHLQDDYDVDLANSVDNAIQMIKKNNYHIALTDLVMPERNGIELLNIIKREWPQISVIMISGKANIEKAVQAMKLGAEDFIEKPVENLDVFKFKIEKILKSKWQLREIKRLKGILARGFDRSDFVGNSAAIQQVMEKVKKIAKLDTTVFISGETGVGKDMVAEMIYKNSKRKNNKFVAVNCGGLTENLLESTLFGHKKGAFTDAIRDKVGYFQEADHGTLFLDEITETSQAFQIKLLKVLEKGMIRKVGGDKDIEVDVRILTATNKNIEKEVKNGNFREDLYYRLNVFRINIPPLKKRNEDIKLLARVFAEKFGEKYGKKNIILSKNVISILMAHKWKGNVRELKNTIEHAVAMTNHNIIQPEDLPTNIYKSKQNYGDYLPNLFNIPYPKAKEVFEKAYIKSIINETHGDVTEAAKKSQIKRQNLYNKFKKFDIDIANYRE